MEDPSLDPGRPPGKRVASGDGPRNAPDTPRWVKVFAIVTVVLVLLFVVVHLAGRGLGEHMH